MKHEYDIFRMLPGGDPIWVNVVDDLEKAQEIIYRLAAQVPARYLVYNLSNGNDPVLKFEATADTPSQRVAHSS